MNGHEIIKKNWMEDKNQLKYLGVQIHEIQLSKATCVYIHIDEYFV